MNTKCDTGVVKVFLQLLDGQAEDRLYLLSGQVTDAFAGFHVFDEPCPHAAQVHGSQIVLPLKTGVPQNLPEQLVIALLPVLEQLLLLLKRIPDFVLYSLEFQNICSRAVREILSGTLEQQAPQRRAVLELHGVGRGGSARRGGRQRGRGIAGVARCAAVAAVAARPWLRLEEDLLQQRVSLHCGILFLREEVRVKAVVNVLLRSWRCARHCAVGRVLPVSQTLGQKSEIRVERGCIAKLDFRLICHWNGLFRKQIALKVENYGL